MTFQANHYIPILKCKGAEKRALALLPLSMRQRCTPFLRMAPVPEGKTVDDHASRLLKNLRSPFLHGAPFYADAVYLERTTNGAATFFSRAAGAGFDFKPVVRLAQDPAELKVALSHAAKGIALYVSLPDYQQEKLHGVEAWLKRAGMSPTAVDLFADMEDIGDMPQDLADETAIDFLNAIPRSKEWRNLILVATSIPRSFGPKAFKMKTQKTIPRAEWELWCRLRRLAHQLPRVPTYADCGIQHPAQPDAIKRRVTPPVVIKYASYGEWVILKGIDPDQRPAIEQYPDLARDLSRRKRWRAHFRGKTHCAGCKEIVLCASGLKPIGDAQGWRRVGAVHHITMTTQMLARETELEAVP